MLRLILDVLTKGYKPENVYSSHHSSHLWSKKAKQSAIECYSFIGFGLLVGQNKISEDSIFVLRVRIGGYHYLRHFSTK